MAFGQHHLDPVAGEQPDGGSVDAGIEHGLGASLEHRHAAAALTRGADDARRTLASLESKAGVSP